MVTRSSAGSAGRFVTSVTVSVVVCDSGSPRSAGVTAAGSAAGVVVASSGTGPP